MISELSNFVSVVFTEHKTAVAIAAVTIGGIATMFFTMPSIFRSMEPSSPIQREHDFVPDVEDTDVQRGIDDALRAEIFAAHRLGFGLPAIASMIGLPMRRVLAVLDNEPLPVKFPVSTRPTAGAIQGE